ncbi:MAG TPA: hypothetical protein PLH34_00940 [Bacillota bacterium]|nr:hypothetical protein [Bacillota bacterium]
MRVGRYDANIIDEICLHVTLRKSLRFAVGHIVRESLLFRSIGV